MSTKPLTDPQELADALERMHVDPNNYAKISEYQTALRGELGKLTRGQMEAFGQIFRDQSTKAWRENVKNLTFTRMEIPTVRYTLKGTRGLFNYASARSFVQKIMEQ